MRQRKTIRLRVGSEPVPNVWMHHPALWLGLHGPMSARAVYLVVQNAGIRAGVLVHPHQLRHAWVHHFLTNGGQFPDLMVLGGWARADTALRYGSFAASARAMTAARQLSLGDRL